MGQATYSYGGAMNYGAGYLFLRWAMNYGAGYLFLRWAMNYGAACTTTIILPPPVASRENVTEKKVF